MNVGTGEVGNGRNGFVGSFIGDVMGEDVNSAQTITHIGGKIERGIGILVKSVPTAFHLGSAVTDINNPEPEMTVPSATTGRLKSRSISFESLPSLPLVPPATGTASECPPQSGK